MMEQVAKFLKENRKLTDASGAIIKKINVEEMGEILKKLKAKGVFKQGGTIDKQRIQRYKEFINK
jgi:predicted HTH transcriptional regulator